MMSSDVIIHIPVLLTVCITVVVGIYHFQLYYYYYYRNATINKLQYCVVSVIVTGWREDIKSCHVNDSLEFAT